MPKENAKISPATTNRKKLLGGKTQTQKCDVCTNAGGIKYEQKTNGMKTTDVVARKTTVIYLKRSERETKGPKTKTKRKQGSLKVRMYNAKCNDEQDICNMYKNKINNKTSRGNTWSG